MQKSRSTLKKSFSPGAIWAVSLGSIIGWGCFIQGANWTLRAGGPLALVLGLLLGGALITVIGFSYSFMIAKFPVAGGEFAYAYRGFGRTCSFICGWMLSLGYLSIVALNATALPLLASYIFPGVFQQGYLYTIAGWDVYAGEVALSCFFIIFFGVMNYRGTKASGKTQLAMVLIMVGAVLISLCGTIATGSFNLANLTPAFGVDTTFIGGVISIIALAPFLYVGFDCIPQAAEEYDFPPEKSKLLIVSSILMGAFIYAIMAIITDVVIPWQEVSALTDSTGATVNWYTGAVIDLAMGPLGVIFVAIAVSMGICTGINGFYMSSSRLFFGMARANMLPACFAKVHTKYNTPNLCVLFVMAVTCLCPFFGREVIGWVVDMCSVGTAVGYFFTCACAFILIKKDKCNEDKNLIHPITAFLGALISCGILLLLVIPGSPGYMSIQSFVALFIWIGLGIIFYFQSRHRFIALPSKELDRLVLGDDVDAIRK